MGLPPATAALAVLVALGPLAVPAPASAQQSFSGSNYGSSRAPSSGPEDYFGSGRATPTDSAGQRPYPVTVPEAEMAPAPYASQTAPQYSPQPTPLDTGSRIVTRPAPPQAAAPAYPTQPATPAPTAQPYPATAPAAPQSAAAQPPDPVPNSLDEWSVLLGAGGKYAPVYPGASENEFSFRPIFDARVGRYLFANNERGVGVYLTETPRLRAGLAGNVDWGRDEDDDSRLNGMGNLDASLELGGFADYQVGKNLWLGADLKQSVTDGGHGGLLAKGHVTYEGQTANGLTFSLGPHATWASQSYMESYFGVDATQAANSGHRLYEPGGGFRDVGVSGEVRFPVSERVLLVGGGEWSYLLGEAADSPLVEEENQLSIYGGIGYQF
ncbi:MipA/OmpV family protein [Roseospirillum parvum]|uniref:MipA/OmpV family protein n=1 Tax=Roseospirillum parvum TaxID=83401 RepID=UPI00116059D9|nr:MipA/OmpV family protein [Roseospirillum parvum]